MKNREDTTTPVSKWIWDAIRQLGHTVPGLEEWKEEEGDIAIATTFSNELMSDFVATERAYACAIIGFRLCMGLPLEPRNLPPSNELISPSFVAETMLQAFGMKVTGKEKTVGECFEKLIIPCLLEQVLRLRAIDQGETPPELRLGQQLRKKEHIARHRQIALNLRLMTDDPGRLLTVAQSLALGDKRMCRFFQVFASYPDAPTDVRQLEILIGLIQRACGF